MVVIRDHCHYILKLILILEKFVSREITKRFRVDPGNYLIIPSTYEEDHDCEFMLRIYTETPIDAGHLHEDKDPDELSDDDKHLDIKKEDTTKAYWQDIMNFICPIIFNGFKKSKNKTLNNIGEFLGNTFFRLFDCLILN